MRETNCWFCFLDKLMGNIIGEATWSFEDRPLSWWLNSWRTTPAWTQPSSKISYSHTGKIIHKQCRLTKLLSCSKNPHLRPVELSWRVRCKSWSSFWNGSRTPASVTRWLASSSSGSTTISRTLKRTRRWWSIWKSLRQALKMRRCKDNWGCSTLPVLLR